MFLLAVLALTALITGIEGFKAYFENDINDGFNQVRFSHQVLPQNFKIINNPKST